MVQLFFRFLHPITYHYRNRNRTVRSWCYGDRVYFDLKQRIDMGKINSSPQTTTGYPLYLSTNCEGGFFPRHMSPVFPVTLKNKIDHFLKFLESQFFKIKIETAQKV